MRRILVTALLVALTVSAATVSAAAAWPAAAPPTAAAEVAGMRLTGPFTLTYAVTLHDVRPLALRLAQSGGRRPQPDENFLITLSARDDRLLYKRGRDVVILDGERAYQASDGGSKFGSVWADQGWVGKNYHDQNVDRLPFLPLPGVGMPGVDLIQSPVRAQAEDAGRARFTGLAPRLNFIGDGTYFPGAVEVARVGGRLRAVSLTLRSDLANEAWTFGAYRRFRGQWIAARVRLSQWQGAVPTFVSTYALVKASPTAPSAAQFDLRTYLVKGANVFDMTGIRGSVNFVYDPLAGDLKAQADRARLAQDAARATQKQP